MIFKGSKQTFQKLPMKAPPSKKDDPGARLFTVNDSDRLYLGLGSSASTYSVMFGPNAGATSTSQYSVGVGYQPTVRWYL